MLMNAIHTPFDRMSSLIGVNQFEDPDLAEAQGKHYTVILASGNEDGGKRATLALSMACTAKSIDFHTQVFLVGDGSYWAYQDHATDIHIAGFPPHQQGAGQRLVYVCL